MSPARRSTPSARRRRRWAGRRRPRSRATTCSSTIIGPDGKPARVEEIEGTLGRADAAHRRPGARRSARTSSACMWPRSAPLDFGKWDAPLRRHGRERHAVPPAARRLIRAGELSHGRPGFRLPGLRRRPYRRRHGGQGLSSATGRKPSGSCCRCRRPIARPASSASRAASRSMAGRALGAGQPDAEARHRRGRPGCRAAGAGRFPDRDRLRGLRARRRRADDHRDREAARATC